MKSTGGRHARHTLSRRAVVGALGVALLASCGPVVLGGEGLGGSKAYPTYHYRLTVEVATQQGARRGSRSCTDKSLAKRGKV